MLNHRIIAPIMFISLAAMITSTAALAEVRKIGDDTIKLRVRVGDNNPNNINKVIFNLPGQNQLGNGTEVASLNSILGGSGAFTVRVVTDNRRDPPGTAKLFADSSSPMTCQTAVSCDGTSISFTKISWERRDGDNFNSASSFDGSNNQLLHQQTVTDTDPANPKKGYRYRDYIKFKYANDIFLPAGTYRGRVTFYATHPN